MPNKKIVVVTKDDAEFLIYRPLVALLRACGYLVVVIAEGNSLDKWIKTLKAGESVYGGRPEGGHYDPLTKCRDDISGLSALKELKPDLVLTGLGAPINLGEAFGLAANELGIKLGYVIDVWGAETRSRAVPNFICTLDAFGKAKIASNKRYNGKDINVHITGSPAMDRLAGIEAPGLKILSSGLEGLTVVLFAGQDESTTPALRGLVQALDVDELSYVLIPRFHTEFLGRPELLAEWSAILAAAKGYVLQVPASVTIQELMKIGDFTVSIYSNALIEAAALGSLPVSWVSDIGREKMSAALGGLTRFPLVDYGCAVEVERPEEFTRLRSVTAEWRKEKIRHCQSVFRADGKNAGRVVSVIEEELR